MRRRILVTLRWSAGLKDTAAAAGEHLRCGNDDPERFQGARRRRALAGDDASRAPPELRPVRLERLPEVDVPDLAGLELRRDKVGCRAQELVP